MQRQQYKANIQKARIYFLVLCWPTFQTVLTEIIQFQKVNCVFYAYMMQFTVHVHRDQVLIGQIYEHDTIDSTLLELVFVLWQPNIIEPF